MLATEKADAISQTKSTEPLRRWLRVETALSYAGISRSFLYQILNSRKVASHMIGRARLIDRESLDAFISSAPVGDFDCGTKIAKRRAANLAA